MRFLISVAIICVAAGLTVMKRRKDKELGDLNQELRRCKEKLKTLKNRNKGSWEEENFE